MDEKHENEIERLERLAKEGNSVAEMLLPTFQRIRDDAAREFATYGERVARVQALERVAEAVAPTLPTRRHAWQDIRRGLRLVWGGVKQLATGRRGR